MGSNSPRGRYDFEDIPRLNALLDHDLLLNWVANKHIDWTNATDNLLTTGSGRFDGGVAIGANPLARFLYIYKTGAHGFATGVCIDNYGAGDAVVRFELNEVAKFTLGVDNDDGDKFKISRGGVLGTTDALAIDSSGNFVIGGTINTLSILDGGSGINLSGDGTTATGLDIFIPNTATNSFYYGLGGTEHHYFGNAGNVEITDDGIINWSGGGSVNANAAYTHIGESGASHSLLGATPGTVSASLAIIVDASKDIDFDGGDIASTGALTFGPKAATEGEGYINVNSDTSNLATKGFGIFSNYYPDVSSLTAGRAMASDCVPYGTQSGFSGLYYGVFGSVKPDAGNYDNDTTTLTLTGLWFEVALQNDFKGASRDAAGLTTKGLYVTSKGGSAGYAVGTGAGDDLNVNMVNYGGQIISTLDGTHATPNTGYNYGLHIETVDSLDAGPAAAINSYTLYLKSMANTNLNGGESYAIYSESDVPSIIAGTLRIDNKLAFTQVDGNEYIDSLNDGYMDYGATTGHRFDAPVGIGTTAPDSIFHIKANVPGTVGSHPAGQLIIQDPDDTVFGNAVITGYESDGAGNPDQQLWYLGSSSSGDSNIIFLNRRNSKLQLGTNDVSRLTILGNGNVGINETAPQDKLEVNGTILVKDKLKFTQDDGNEYIDSLADGYLDLAATTGIRLNGNVRIGSAVAPTVALDVTGAALISTTLGVTGVATLGDSSQMATSAAPTADADLANKKYVDDSVAGNVSTTGSYTGDGTVSKGVAGIGFSPSYVKIIERETVSANSVQVFYTTPEIVDDNANGGALFLDDGGVQVFAADAIISLDADGFTVDDAGIDAHPNKLNAVYNYICIR